MQQQLTYVDKGRGGTIVYRDEQGDINLFFEYGGGNCVVIIYVPSTDEWTSKTKRSVSARKNILAFIAEQSVKDKAPGCYYKISEHFIEIFSSQK